MTLDYETPEQKPPPRYGLWGTIVGAVGLPATFLIVAFIGDDAGGPCFWPFAVFIGAGLGWLAGTLVAARSPRIAKKQRDNQPLERTGS